MNSLEINGMNLDLRRLALQAADRLPLLPAVFQRTLALFADGDDVSVGDLASVVEQDVAIAGHLISIANSALYCRTGSVCSVRHAIARIGVPKTRNALLGLSVSRPFRQVRLPKSWSSARFNSHSLAVAILSDLLVQTVPTDNAEWAFLTGLMHDVGLLVLATAFPEEALAVSDAGSDYQLAEWEREILGFTHFEIGADLLERWNCPRLVQDASVFCQSNAFAYRNPLSLGMVVKTASLLADADGISTFGAGQDGSFVPALLEAMSIQKPAAFLDLFHLEYRELQSCVAGKPEGVSA
jgi:HD-like signal output (HDOD) protein